MEDKMKEEYIFLDVLDLIATRKDVLKKDDFAFILTSEGWGREATEQNKKEIKRVFKKYNNLIVAFHDRYVISDEEREEHESSKL